jgi:hypothetical protein
VMRVLLEAGADKDRAADDEYTPLHMACGSGHVEVVRLLLEWRAEQEMTSDGSSPLDVALFRGRTDLAAWLGVTQHWTPLQLACEARREAGVVATLRSDVSHSLTLPSWSPLQCALATPATLPLALPVSSALVDTLRLAAGPWSPRCHHLYPASFRAAVRAVLLVQHRTRLMHEPGLWLHVLSFAGRDWFRV